MSPPLARALARKEARGEGEVGAADDDEEGETAAAEVETVAEEDSRRRC